MMSSPMGQQKASGTSELPIGHLVPVDFAFTPALLRGLLTFPLLPFFLSPLGSLQDADVVAG